VVDFSWRFDGWFKRLPTSPTDVGEVCALVIRPREGERGTPDSIELTTEGGISGDRWINDEHSRPTNQVSMINVHLLRTIVEGEEERMALSGDNLQVDLNLTAENLPPGTLLNIGTAVLVITDDPHRPCKRFIERFGLTNTKRVSRADRIGRRGRGVLCQILQGGTITKGDVIFVKRTNAVALM
jgi:MOSC domain-containing protein YiiM